MKQRNLRLVIFVVVLAAIGVLCWAFSVIDRPAPPLRWAIEESELVLTKEWNEEVVRVPGALTIPDALKNTREYRRILSRGHVNNFRFSDLDGNSYVAYALGRQQNSEGEYYVWFGKMEKRRPDGSLENVTFFHDDCVPVEWKILDEDGNRTMLVMAGGGYASNVLFYEADNQERFAKEWEVNSESQIISEQLLDENGDYYCTHKWW